MDDLWGNLPEIKKIATPYSILRTQGELLEKKTDGSITGEAIKTAKDGNFQIRFFLLAKRLNNYRYHMFNVIHQVHIYPLTIIRPGYQQIECASEEVFIHQLRTIFTSKEAVGVISGLMAQLQDEEDDDIPF